MPEYLAPGVYIEETSFRTKTIEGLSTSTAGFIGPARFGPAVGVPELLTSFGDFERVYGGLDQLQFEGEAQPADNYVAQGVASFFENGGQRLYVTRVYANGTGVTTAFADLPVAAPSSLPSPRPTPRVTLNARFPGSGGNLRYTFTLHVGRNSLVAAPGTGNPALRGVTPFDLVWISAPGVGSLPGAAGATYWSERVFDNTTGQTTWRFHPATGGSIRELSTLVPAIDRVQVLRCSVEVTYLGRTTRTDLWNDLAFHPAHPESLSATFARELASRIRTLTTPLVFETEPATMDGPQIAQLIFGTITPASDEQSLVVQLTNGTDGVRPAPTAYQGSDTDPKNKTGLRTFEDIADISIVAAPGASWGGNSTRKTEALATMGLIVSHSEKMKYRIAVLDAPNDQSLSEVMEFRAQFDSTHAALYYPWVRIFDPVLNKENNMPPSGYVAGIYARNDIERGVHKAPANEVVRGAVRFEFMLNKAQQDVLNPLGINCFRALENRGNRLWGARAATSDGEWKYVNLRRFFAYLERSIERGTQFAVFEPNGDALWANVRRTVEDFLFSEWTSGRLFGRTPEEAYFVRCDRSTMSQNDIDNGRMICLVGVSPLRPAEFVIFRIGQWVAPRKG